MPKHAVVFVSCLTVLGIAGERLLAQKPVDPCSLVTPAELQTLAGTAKVDAGAASTDALGSRSCQYRWGTGGNVQGGRSFLTVIVAETAKTNPGVSPALLRDGLLMQAKMDAANTSAIAGIGDAAIFESNAPIRSKAQALVKGVMVLINFESADARQRRIR
jgi:hypothetical protein